LVFVRPQAITPPYLASTAENEGVGEGLEDSGLDLDCALGLGQGYEIDKVEEGERGNEILVDDVWIVFRPCHDYVVRNHGHDLDQEHHDHHRTLLHVDKLQFGVWVFFPYFHSSKTRHHVVICHDANDDSHRHSHNPAQVVTSVCGEHQKKLNDACTSSHVLHVPFSDPYHSQVPQESSLDHP